VQSVSEERWRLLSCLSQCVASAGRPVGSAVSGVLLLRADRVHSAGRLAGFVRLSLDEERDSRSATL